MAIQPKKRTAGTTVRVTVVRMRNIAESNLLQPPKLHALIPEQGLGDVSQEGGSLDTEYDTVVNLGVAQA